ncbi:MAG: transglutaminase family protein [bacterium]
MRYEILHTTRYMYADVVGHGINIAHLLPRNTFQQSCCNSSIQVNPLPTTFTERTDYFGNRVCHFSIEQNHHLLEVTARSEVDIAASNGWQGLDFGNSCGQVREMLCNSTDPDVLLAREFILDSPLIAHFDGLRDYAAPLFSDDRPFLSAVIDLNSQINRDFTYDPHFTDISTPLQDVFDHRKGVCQDFAHLAIGCLRSLGFPARYVSGYLETLPPPGQAKLIGSDATHAWFSVYSPGEGWFDLDPTNNTVTQDQHITTAWGRDYSDVTPLRGVIFGGGEQHELQVSVDVNRIG